MWPLLASGAFAETFFFLWLEGLSSIIFLVYSLLASKCFFTYWAYLWKKKKTVFPDARIWLKPTPMRKKHCFSTGVFLTYLLFIWERLVLLGNKLEHLLNAKLRVLLAKLGQILFIKDGIWRSGFLWKTWMDLQENVLQQNCISRKQWATQ